jgi:hypothetical protein
MVANPERILHRAVLFVRAKGDTDYRAIPVELPAEREYTTRVLDPVPGLEADQVLQVHLAAFDEKGNEVLRVFDAGRPREITLTWEPTPSWYSRWWVWAIAGVVVATATGVGVYAAQDEMPHVVGGTLTWGRP